MCVLLVAVVVYDRSWAVHDGMAVFFITVRIFVVVIFVVRVSGLLGLVTGRLV